MKLSSMFVGKLVRGIKGKVKPVFGQENPEEPIGIIRDFLTNYDDGGIVVPFIQWIGQIEDLAHCVHPDNLQELEE